MRRGGRPIWTTMSGRLRSSWPTPMAATGAPKWMRADQAPLDVHGIAGDPDVEIPGWRGVHRALATRVRPDDEETRAGAEQGREQVLEAPRLTRRGDGG